MFCTYARSGVSLRDAFLCDVSSPDDASRAHELLVRGDVAGEVFTELSVLGMGGEGDAAPFLKRMTPKLVESKLQSLVLTDVEVDDDAAVDLARAITRNRALGALVLEKCLDPVLMARSKAKRISPRAYYELCWAARASPAPLGRVFVSWYMSRSHGKWELPILKDAEAMLTWLVGTVPRAQCCSPRTVAHFFDADGDSHLRRRVWSFLQDARWADPTSPPLAHVLEDEQPDL